MTPMTSPKIQIRHVRRTACVYVRQSTMHQVRDHQASTELQYGLADRAVSLGWERSAVRIYDGDLGVGGGVGTDRRDFNQLVADVGLGRVGIVLAFDATRIARNNADWHRLLDLCAVCDTLIADSDGVYEMASYNDRLLLGMKGTMSEAEHHMIKARLQAGIDRRAASGELRRRLPVGFEYDELGEVRLALDEAVRHAIETIFQLFSRLGTAHAVYGAFGEQGLLLPLRRLDEKEIRWVEPDYGKILRILSNPRYSGTYVYGRTRRAKYVDDEGRIRFRTEHLPPDEWKVVLHDHHAGYITWEQFEENRRRLKANNLRMSKGEGSTVLRAGRALLQGLIRCGRCGRRMSAIYPSKGDTVRYSCDKAKRSHGGEVCFSIGSGRLHAAVVETFLDALSPASLDVTLAAIEQLDHEDDVALRQLQQRRERAHYDVQRARRQYDAVEPENRLVARTLEARWNQRLAELADLDRQIEERCHQQPPTLSAAERRRLREFGLDLRRVWKASTTLPQERKQLLRAAFEDVFVAIDRERRVAQLTLTWQGGAVTETEIQMPKVGGHTRIDDGELVEQVRTMAASLTDHQIANTLVRRAIRTTTGLAFNAMRVCGLRKRHGIPEFKPNAEATEEPSVTCQQAAEMLEVTNTTVRRWLRDGFVIGTQVAPRAPWRINVSALEKLKTAREAPDGWLLPKEAAKALGASRAAVLQLARTGEVDCLLVGTGRRRGLRINVATRTSIEEPSLFAHR